MKKQPKIEKHIKIPARRGHVKWLPTARRMRRGDSVLVSSCLELSAAIRSIGCRAVTRCEEGRIRVWKL